jgi:hypothetical protein
VRARDLAGLVTRAVARRHRGNRETALREALARIAPLLGAARWARWPRPERHALECWAMILTLVPDLARWPGSDRAKLVRVLRAKGGRGEGPYVHRLRAHRRLHRSLVALVRAEGPRG